MGQSSRSLREKCSFFSCGCTLQGEMSQPWLKSRPEFETVSNNSQLVGCFGAKVVGATSTEAF